jgi:hypothetical protein
MNRVCSSFRSQDLACLTYEGKFQIQRRVLHLFLRVSIPSRISYALFSTLHMHAARSPALYLDPESTLPWPHR